MRNITYPSSKALDQHEGGVLVRSDLGVRQSRTIKSVKAVGIGAAD